ncbi:MAG TPA: Rrf2 family transcriptional regulator [Gemmatimonadaceae bacterium]|nr:Rrf2 family transcriptional regulator [Gemmatimonadaceae bacterium]
MDTIPTKSLGICPGSVDPRARNSPLTTRQTFHGSGAVAFSTKGEYGVRLMAQLASRYGRGPASLAEVAADEDLPRAYLEQLVIHLRDAGLVVSTRGARGGYTLAAPPSEIRMSEVLRALEGPIAPMICASDDPEHAQVCDRSARCTVNVLWVRVRDAIAGTLESMTLADLVPTHHYQLDPTAGDDATAPSAIAGPTLQGAAS